MKIIYPSRARSDHPFTFILFKPSIKTITNLQRRCNDTQRHTHKLRRVIGPREDRDHHNTAKLGAAITTNQQFWHQNAEHSRTNCSSCPSFIR